MRALSVTPRAAGSARVEDPLRPGVNANLRHYRAAANALAKADIDWLRRLITRRPPLDRFADGLSAQPDDVEVVLTMTDQDR